MSKKYKKIFSLRNFKFFFVVAVVVLSICYVLRDAYHVSVSGSIRIVFEVYYLAIVFPLLTVQWFAGRIPPSKNLILRVVIYFFKLLGCAASFPVTHFIFILYLVAGVARQGMSLVYSFLEQFSPDLAFGFSVFFILVYGWWGPFFFLRGYMRLLEENFGLNYSYRPGKWEQPRDEDDPDRAFFRAEKNWWDDLDDL